MQADRRFKWVPTLCVALVAAGAGSSWAQTTNLRPPVSGLGSGARLGTLNSPVSPASSPAMGTLQNTPAMLQAPRVVQAPISSTPVLAPRSAVTPQAQTAHPQANVPDARKTRQLALPQRAQCIAKFALDGSWSLPTAVAMNCEVQDQWVLMEFVVSSRPVFDKLVAAQKAGFSLWIDYEDSAAAAEGNPKRQMAMVGASEAYKSYMHVVCLSAGDRHSLRVGPRGDQPYPQVTTFCTDGQRVTPVTFASDKASWSLLYSNVEDGPLVIDYQLVMGGRHPKTGVIRPYPIESIRKLTGKWYTGNGSGDPVLAGGVLACTYEGSFGASACFGASQPDKVGQKPKSSVTAYKPYLKEVSVADDLPVPSLHTKFTDFYLMPGVVPPEFRNATQGACRVALYRDIRVIQTSSGIGVGHSHEPHPKDGYCRKLYANDTAIWAFSYLRQEERCFRSHEEVDADRAADTKNRVTGVTPPPPPTPGVDNCALLPR